jgi:hypothetical protein
MTIETIYGPMEEDLLRKVELTDEDDNAHYWAVEYYLKDELVHRSARVDLKRGLALDIFTERLG